MQMHFRRTWALGLVLVLAGCATMTRSLITNLTPTHLERNRQNLYPFSVQFDSRQYTLKEETLQAYVLLGEEIYPMQRVPLVKNRWETLVPIPPGKKTVYYKFKFTYDYKRIPEERSDSMFSRDYQLDLVD